MPPRLWQRQPGETPPDFIAFTAYLRLKGRRSHRAVATQTGRSLSAIRRLSAQFNWRTRVAAFEARLADASQGALDLLLRSTTTRSTAEFERLRCAEFLLAQRVVHESTRWLKLASDPHRRDVSLGQVCQVIDLGFKLRRLATGMPAGDEPRRRPRKEDTPGYWTTPSAEEALKKIYGAPLEGEQPDSPPPAQPLSGPIEGDREPQSGDAGDHPLNTSVASSPVGSPAPAKTDSHSLPAKSEPPAGHLPPSTAAQPPAAAPDHRRRDAWAAWTRLQRRSPNTASA